MNHIKIKPLYVADKLAELLAISCIKNIVCNETAVIEVKLFSTKKIEVKKVVEIPILGKLNEDGTQATIGDEQVIDVEYTIGEELITIDIPFTDYKNWEDDRNVINFVCSQLGTERI